MTNGQDRDLPDWSPHELGVFVGAVRTDDLFALWMLIATTGIRLDVLVDLRREDVDLQHPQLSPRPSAVIKQGIAQLGVAKTFALDPGTHEALREHVVAWDKEHSGTRPRSAHLFAWPDGAPLHPKSVEVLFRHHCHTAELPVVPLQGMRWAYVVAAIETGVPISVISERLGSSVSLSALRIPRVTSPDPQTSPKPTATQRRATKTDRSKSCHLRSC